MTDRKQFIKIVYSPDFEFGDDDIFYPLCDKLRAIAQRMHKRVRASTLREIDEEMEAHVGGGQADSEYWSRLNAAASALWFYGWQKCC